MFNGHIDFSNYWSHFKDEKTEWKKEHWRQKELHIERPWGKNNFGMRDRKAASEQNIVTKGGELSEMEPV